MQWPSFDRREKINLFLGVFFCIIFGIRYYPHDWQQTIFESTRWIFGFFFYSVALTFILHGLLQKLFKKTFSLKTGIKIVVWLALACSISQSLHDYLNLPHPKGFTYFGY